MKILLLASLLLLKDCEGNPNGSLRVEKATEGNYEVTLLFRHDGCNMYKFYDNSQWIYFAKCDHDTTVRYKEEHSSVTTDSRGDVITEVYYTPKEVKTKYNK